MEAAARAATGAAVKEVAATRAAARAAAALRLAPATTLRAGDDPMDDDSSSEEDEVSSDEDNDMLAPERHLPPPGQRGHNPQRHAAAGTAAPTSRLNRGGYLLPNTGGGQHTYPSSSEGQTNDPPNAGTEASAFHRRFIYKGDTSTHEKYTTPAHLLLT